MLHKCQKLFWDKLREAPGQGILWTLEYERDRYEVQLSPGDDVREHDPNTKLLTMMKRLCKQISDDGVEGWGGLGHGPAARRGGHKIGVNSSQKYSTSQYKP